MWTYAARATNWSKSDWQQHNFMYRGPGTEETAGLSGEKKKIAEEYRPLCHVASGKIVVLRISGSGGVVGLEPSAGTEASTKTETALGSSTEAGPCSVPSHWKHIEYSVPAKKGDLGDCLKCEPHIIQFDGHDEHGLISLNGEKVDIKSILYELKRCGQAAQGVLLNACYEKVSDSILKEHAGFVLYPATPQQSDSLEGATFFSGQFYRNIGLGKSLLESFDEASQARSKVFGISVTYKLDVRKEKF
jgi:hypothetical protein